MPIIKAKLMKESVKQFIVTQRGASIVKDDWSEVDTQDPEVMVAIKRDDVEVQEQEKSEEDLEAKEAAEKLAEEEAKAAAEKLAEEEKLKVEEEAKLAEEVKLAKLAEEDLKEAEAKEAEAKEAEAKEAEAKEAEAKLEAEPQVATEAPVEDELDAIIEG